MIQFPASLATPTPPRREWLLRCTDNDHELSTCSICVSNGSIDIITADHTIIELAGPHLAEFCAAFQAALDQAGADLAKRRSGIPEG